MCSAIVLAGLFLSVGVLVPLNAKAQDMPIDAAVIGKRNILAGQDVNATVQVPSVKSANQHSYGKTEAGRGNAQNLG